VKNDLGEVKNMKQKLTMKSRKDEIFEAYEELLAKSAEKKDEEKEDITKNKVEKIEVEKASEKNIPEEPPAYTVESIVKGLANLKLDLNKTLTDLSDKLIAEVNKLEAIKKEITIETKNLEDVHNIKVNEEKKKVFEEEMTSIRRQWMKEHEEHEIAVKERDEKLKKEREREMEECAYNQALIRKKDKDAYEEEKAALKKSLKEERETQMKELNEREAEIAAQEAEIAELKAKVKTSPIELAKAVEKAEKEAITQTEKEAKQKAELLSKDVETEKKVAELKIKNLEDIMVKQSLQIEALTKQLNTSSEQVLNIASKAIESASGVKTTLASGNEIAVEQTKNVNTKK